MTNLISIVDDDESVRDSTRALLRSVGYPVATFDSGESFLTSEAAVATRCLILDLRMPGIDGLELQKRLKDEHRHVPVIFITAHGDERRRQQAMKAGAVEFFNKPFDASALVAAVQTALSSDCGGVARK